MTKVRIQPTGEAYIDGVPAVEQEVTEGRARELLAFDPPAFRVVPESPPPTPGAPPAAGKAAKRPAGDGGSSVSPQDGEE